MSFDKHMGKDWRKTFTGSKTFDHACRNHGACDWCRENRLIFDKRHRTAADQQLQAYKKFKGERYEEILRYS